MDVIAYSAALKKTRDIGKNKRSETSSLSNALNIFEQELSIYESFIPDFFSKNGDGEGIRKVYNKLKNKKNKQKVYNEYVDMIKASTFYSEYENGMLKFLSEIMESGDIIDEKDHDKISEKLNKASQNDSVFIESIIGGTNNPSSNCVLEEAVSSIEYLIDFIPEIRKFKDKCRNLCEKAQMSNGNPNLIEGGCRLYFESVSDYCFNMIDKIITSYASINNILFEHEDDVTIVNNHNKINHKVF